MSWGYCMRAADMFEGVEFCLLAGSMECEVTGLTEDSRQVSDGDVFVCRSGVNTDGHRYIRDAVMRGAVGVIVTGHTDACMYKDCGFVAELKNFRRDIGRLCNNLWNYPSKQMVVIGITGTKGKTTTAFMIHRILNLWGHRAGLIGTIEIDDGEEKTLSANTTPDVIYLHRRLADMVRNGVEYCVMEVSSQGLMKNRVAGVYFDIGVFTNLSPDHIGANEHSTFEEYVRWKSKLFSMCSLGVICRDDKYAATVAACAHESGIPIASYGIGTDAGFSFAVFREYAAVDVRRIVTDKIMGTQYSVEAGGVERTVTVGIPGLFNVRNSLAALAVSDIIGVPAETAQAALADMSVAGRLESVEISDDFKVLIDYAHNAVSLRNVLLTIRSYSPARIICLFGCGGNRSRGRRTGMGRVSGELADLTVITSDNPRYEEPDRIMSDIEEGVISVGGRYVKLADRKDAIRYALRSAGRGDVVLLAGKGHENYQEINGKKYPMDERVLIQEILEEEDAGAICGCNNRYIT